MKLMLSFDSVGAHILSGNVFEPRALNELLPQWKQEEVYSSTFPFHYITLIFITAPWVE